jgi:transposase
MNPPDKAIVLSVDEKSQIQALDRTQPILPLRPGLPQRQTHDYERHGTTTLFAALNVIQGTVITECHPKHRHQEFLRFLDRIEASTDPVLDIHLIWDNYGTHKHPEVKAWLADRPRYHVHFTPTRFFMAESGGALVRRDHAKADPPRYVSKRRRSGESN